MKVYLCCVFLLITTVVFSQNKVSLSTKEYLELQDKTRSYFNSDIDSAFWYSTKIEKSQNRIHKAFASGVKGYLYAKKGDFTDAKRHYKRALELIKDAPKSQLKTQNEAYIYNYGGLIDWMNGDDSKALDNYLIALKLSESIKDFVQVVKINNNIALVNSNVGNYKEAIAITKKSKEYIEKNRLQFTESQFMQNMSNSCVNIGNYYEYAHNQNKAKTHLLDSAFSYYTKTLIFSKENIENKLKAQNNIGNLHYKKNNLVEAEKAYLNVLTLAKENDFKKEYYNANYNLGFLCYSNKKYDKALIYFKKVDSMFVKDNELGDIQFINSNYYQSKIYDFYKDHDNAAYHSEIYLKHFQKVELKMNKEELEVNFKLGKLDSEAEMLSLHQKHKNKVLFKNGMIGFLGVLFIVLLILFLKNYRSKKIAEQKVSMLIEEYKNSAEELNRKEQFNLDKDTIADKTDGNAKDESAVVSEENEKEIIAKLKLLEDKFFYLKPEFSQQEVAKRIKTNTTYLSYVVNKNYGKSFSVYYNELRIKFVINEIMNNSKYREYTTLAIAESAGFKNADSFATSFKKKTGVTPYQFINEVKKRELV
ncbi:MAG TPA: helix-turn-helix domain-containing protein [Flavobacterium sp.]|nr:helix-turn-helix domain-containing protein [Flavobacterium sp.]